MDHKEGWAPRNWCFQIVVLKKTLESPLVYKDQSVLKETPVNPKGNQPWIFTGRTDAEAEATVLWTPDVKSWLIGKDPAALLLLGKIEGKRKREWQRMRWLDGMADSMDRNLSKLQDTVENRGAWCAAVCGVAKGQTWSSDWTTPTNHRFVCSVVRVYFCFVNNFSCIIFFFRFHICDITLYLSLSDLLHLVWSSLVHPCCGKWHYFILFYGWVKTFTVFKPVAPGKSCHTNTFRAKRQRARLTCSGPTRLHTILLGPVPWVTWNEVVSISDCSKETPHASSIWSLLIF